MLWRNGSIWPKRRSGSAVLCPRHAGAARCSPFQPSRLGSLEPHAAYQRCGRALSIDRQRSASNAQAVLRPMLNDTFGVNGIALSHAAVTRTQSSRAPSHHAHSVISQRAVRREPSNARARSVASAGDLSFSSSRRAITERLQAVLVRSRASGLPAARGSPSRSGIVLRLSIPVAPPRGRADTAPREHGAALTRPCSSGARGSSQRASANNAASLAAKYS